MLVQAASGLEKMMAGSQAGVLKDSNVAQISAFVYYQANVIAGLTKNKNFQSKFTQTIFKQIDEDFGQYIDALARTKPKSLHHVYEWGGIGNKNKRLFDLKILSQEGLSFKIGYSFLPSKSLVPASNKSKRRHVFINKAEIMEKGIPLKISPRYAERLVFEIDGETVFMPKGESVMVKRPGGKSATNQFSLAHSRFFTGNLVNNSIKKSRFQQIFNAKMAKALMLPQNIKKVQYKFSPNSIRNQADSALSQAFGGAL
ncbi:MAG: hypothetical protein RLZZ196_29 [Bacteroidota bacterium]|jgi:hypothetical protein